MPYAHREGESDDNLLRNLETREAARNFSSAKKTVTPFCLVKSFGSEGEIETSSENGELKEFCF